MREVAEYICNNCNAGPKAKVDIEKILSKEYDCKVNVWNLSNESEKSVLKKLLRKIKKIIFIMRNFSGNELLIIQAPFYIKFDFLYKMNKNKIAIIHDVDGIRNEDAKKLKKEINFYNTCRYIISHNENMSDFLKENGVKTEIINLELFDYLVKEKKIDNKKDIKQNDVQIAFAGNLKREKAPFLYQIDENKINFKLNVYGVGIEEDINKKITYKGKYAPDELPLNLEGDLGLVWDGNFDESDENVTFKNYTKYNNPHKLSCYMAAGLPVIVWKKAAIANFVEKYNVGYTISNIYDINELDFCDYNQKRENVMDICRKVREGYFTKEALKKLNKDK